MIAYSMQLLLVIELVCKELLLADCRYLCPLSVCSVINTIKKYNINIFSLCMEMPNYGTPGNSLSLVCDLWQLCVWLKFDPLPAYLFLASRHGIWCILLLFLQ